MTYRLTSLVYYGTPHSAFKDAPQPADNGKKHNKTKNYYMREIIEVHVTIVKLHCVYRFS